MSEEKRIITYSRHGRKAHAGRTGRNRATVQSDWSLVSGRLPHMNDPREDNKVFKVTLNGTNSSLFTTSTTIPSGVGGLITSALFPNFSDFGAAFDQYRIMSIEVWIIPQTTNSTALLKSVVDYDNAAITLTQAYFDAYTNCHTTTLQNGHYRKFVPHIAMAAYAGAFTSYANAAHQWIDCASTAVQHYGFKVYADITAAAAIPVEFFCRAKFEFRNAI
jgi:hypothetical protein